MLQEVQLREIWLQVRHSVGHMWHMKKVELLMELAGQDIKQIPSAFSKRFDKV